MGQKSTAQLYLPGCVNVHPHVTHNNNNNLICIALECQMLPWAQPSPQAKQHLYLFNHFCTAHDRVSSGIPRHVLFPKITPLHGGSGPPSNTMVSSAHQSPQPKRHLNLFNRFAQCCRARPLPKNCSFAKGYLNISNTWFLEPTQAHNPNGISIG